MTRRIDAASLERTVDLSIGIADIGSGLDSDTGGGFDFVHLRLDHLAFIRLSSRDRDVQNDAYLVIDGSVLLISRLQPPIASVGGHRCVGIGRADLFVLTALPAFSPTCRSTRLSQLTLARISEASMCTTSAG
jgi:hypothetical protein